MFGTFAILGGGIGTLAGSGTALLISASLPSAAVEGWGWRVPFLGGILIGAVGLYLRQRLPETRQAAGAEHAGAAKLVRALRAQWPTIPRIAGLNLMHAVGVFAVFIYMKTYLQVQVGVGRTEALRVTTIGLITLMSLTAAFGALSDRVGRRPVLIASSTALILFAYPLLALMNIPSFEALLAGQIGFAVIVGAYAGTAPATMAEMLPGHVRVSGTSLGYNLCMALFGGTTPLVVVYVIKISHSDLAPALYLMAAAAVSLAVVIRLQETAKRPLAS